jgi:chemotaxis protein MotB
MARKKKPEEHENLERWLVSYADFITLLFATFVVLYALSQMDLAKFKDLKISLSEAFAPTIFHGKGSDSNILDKRGESVLNESRQGDNVNIIPPINPNLELKQMDKVKEEIEKAVKEGKIEGVSVKQDTRGLVISLMDSVFFDSGSARLKNDSMKILNNVALEIKKNFPGNKIRIEGHTDSDPISSAVFPSNWELSAARAASVVRHFIKSFKMPKESFSAVGYADSVPIATNKTRDGREKNRRVEIVILNSETSKLEPGATPGEPVETASATTPEKKDDEIIIIKGGRTSGDINELEQEVNQSQTGANEEAAKIFEPIEMPINKEEKKSPKPHEILEIEQESYR